MLSADGTQFSANSPQRPVESVVHTAAGQYTITFTGPGGLQMCPRWVSSNVGPRMFSAGHGGFNNFQMFVRTYDANGALTDTPFSLHFSCPS